MEEEDEEKSEHGEADRPRAPPPEMGARDREKWWAAERKRDVLVLISLLSIRR
jgi:hypothetical protein